MAEGPLERIVREADVADLVEILAERLAATDLQSLLLEIYRRRSARMAPADLLAQHESSRFTQPDELDPRAVATFEQLAWSHLPDGYDALELSPLRPLGTNSVVATVNQNKVVSTIRNVEVVADSTNVLALECALRRRDLLRHVASRFEPVCLVASQRQVRAQTFGGHKEWAHFLHNVDSTAPQRQQGATRNRRHRCRTCPRVSGAATRLDRAFAPNLIDPITQRYALIAGRQRSCGA
jgi:hypothetical protein